MSAVSMQVREHCIACRQPTVRDGRGFACTSCGLSLRTDDEGLLVPIRTLSGAAHSEVSYPESGADAMKSVEDTSFWFRHRNEVLTIVLDRFAGAQSVVWDVGGGNGFQASKLQQCGREVVLLEPGRRGCLNALGRGVTSVVCGTIGALELRAGAVDAMCLLDVIEHLPDPVDVLAECARVLRSDGTLVVTVPAHQALWSDEDDYAEHHRRYTKRLLAKELGAAGLRLEFASYFFQPLVIPILLVRALPHRLSFRRGTKAGADLSDHGNGGWSQRALEVLLEREARALRAGRTLAFGSSIIAVARPV